MFHTVKCIRKRILVERFVRLVHTAHISYQLYALSMPKSQIFFTPKSLKMFLQMQTLRKRLIKCSFVQLTLCSGQFIVGVGLQFRTNFLVFVLFGRFGSNVNGSCCTDVRNAHSCLGACRTWKTHKRKMWCAEHEWQKKGTEKIAPAKSNHSSRRASFFFFCSAPAWSFSASPSTRCSSFSSSSSVDDDYGEMIWHAFGSRSSGNINNNSKQQLP